MKSELRALARPPVPKLALIPVFSRSGFSQNSKAVKLSDYGGSLAEITDRSRGLSSVQNRRESSREQVRESVINLPLRQSGVRSEAIFNSVQIIDQSKQLDHLPRSHKLSFISHESDIPGLLVLKQETDFTKDKNYNSDSKLIYPRLSSATPDKFSRVRPKVITSPKQSSSYRSPNTITISAKINNENSDPRQDFMLAEHSKIELTSRTSIKRPLSCSQTPKQSAVLTLEAIQNSCDFFQINSSLSKRRNSARDHKLKLAFQRLNSELEEPELVFNSGYVRKVVDKYIEVKEAEMLKKSYINKLISEKHKLF
jgi:hypothetical protein